MSDLFENFQPKQRPGDNRKSNKGELRRHIENTMAGKNTEPNTEYVAISNEDHILSRGERVQNLEKMRQKTEEDIKKLIGQLTEEKKKANDNSVLIESDEVKKNKLEERLEIINNKFQESVKKSSFLKKDENSRMTKALGHIPRSIGQRELIEHIISLTKFKNEIRHEINKQNAWIAMHTQDADPNISLLIQYVEKAYETRPIKDCVSDINEIHEYLVHKTDKCIEDNETLLDPNKLKKYKDVLQKSKTFFKEMSPGALYLINEPILKPLGHLVRVDSYNELIKYLKLLEEFGNTVKNEANIVGKKVASNDRYKEEKEKYRNMIQGKKEKEAMSILNREHDEIINALEQYKGELEQPQADFKECLKQLEQPKEVLDQCLKIVDELCLSEIFGQEVADLNRDLKDLDKNLDGIATNIYSMRNLASAGTIVQRWSLEGNAESNTEQFIQNLAIFANLRQERQISTQTVQDSIPNIKSDIQNIIKGIQQKIDDARCIIPNYDQLKDNLAK